MNLKDETSIGIIYLPWPTKGSPSLIGFMLLSRQGFYAPGHRDLDLSHTDPKINMDHLTAIAN